MHAEVENVIYSSAICILILLLFQLCCASYRSENRMRTFTLMKLLRYQFENGNWPIAYGTRGKRHIYKIYIFPISIEPIFHFRK